MFVCKPYYVYRSLPLLLRFLQLESVNVPASADKKWNASFFFFHSRKLQNFQGSSPVVRAAVGVLMVHVAGKLISRLR